MNKRLKDTKWPKETDGDRWAREARARCSKYTPAQKAKLYELGMAIVNGKMSLPDAIIESSKLSFPKSIPSPEVPVLYRAHRHPMGYVGEPSSNDSCCWYTKERQFSIEKTLVDWDIYLSKKGLLGTFTLIPVQGGECFEWRPEVGILNLESSVEAQLDRMRELSRKPPQKATRWARFLAKLAVPFPFNR